MIIANLNFSVFNKTSKSEDNVILVTSSVKGEGKTLISVNVANILASKYNKILLIGTDLRNPQIHKFLNISKDTIGLTDYIHRTDINSWNELLIRHKNIDILLSGTIPPDPLSTLSSKKVFRIHKRNEKKL